jgi:hypothetical protein
MTYATRLPSPAAAHAHARTHTHTTSAPIARFCLFACCRTLSSRSAAVTLLFAVPCLTFSAPGKERRARALVESHGLTCAAGRRRDDVCRRSTHVYFRAHQVSRQAIRATKCLGFSERTNTKRVVLFASQRPRHLCHSFCHLTCIGIFRGERPASRCWSPMIYKRRSLRAPKAS